MQYLLMCICVIVAFFILFVVRYVYEHVFISFINVYAVL